MAHANIGTNFKICIEYRTSGGNERRMYTNVVVHVIFDIVSKAILVECFVVVVFFETVIIIACVVAAATTTATATAATSPTLTFDHVDCRQLWDKYGAEAFQAVVDKACLDSMLSGGEEGKIIAMETCKQVDRILRDGGHFVVVSHAHPETALGKILMVECVLSNVDTATARWSVDIHSTEEDSSDSEEEEEEVGGIHVYVFKKVVRARTRSLKRKRLRFSDDDFRIERHFH